MYAAVLGAVSGLVGMTGVVWVAFVVVFSITGFALCVSLGAVMMGGMGMMVVVTVAVVGVTVAAFIVVIDPDGVPRLYARPLPLGCMPCTCIMFVCLATLPHQKKKTQGNLPLVLAATNPSALPKPKIQEISDTPNAGYEPSFLHTRIHRLTPSSVQNP